GIESLDWQHPVRPEDVGVDHLAFAMENRVHDALPVDGMHHRLPDSLVAQVFAGEIHTDRYTPGGLDAHYVDAINLLCSFEIGDLNGHDIDLAPFQFSHRDGWRADWQ